MGISEFVKQVETQSILFEEVIKASRSLLYNHPIAAKALSYLDSRLPRRAQEKFQFGYFPEDEYLDTFLSMVNKDKLYSLHLLYNKYIPDSDFTTQITCGSLAQHNLIMPYKDAYNNTVALVGRSLLSEQERKELKIAKYKNTTFTKSLQLFGLNYAKDHIIKQNSVLIVEGQVDCITAHMSGIKNTVALGGVAFSNYQFCMLNRYTNNFYLALDNDEEGKNSAKKIIKRFSKYANFNIIEIPLIYKDLDEAIRNSPTRLFLDRIFQ